MPEKSSDPRRENGGQHLHDMTVTEIDGKRALIVQAVIRDSDPPELKQALAVRREANLTGECPDCGERMRLPNRAERRRAARTGQVLHAFLEHEDDCVAYLDGDRRWSK